jgi:hypothetical protein
LKNTGLLALICILGTVGATAQTSLYTATLVQPLSAHKMVVANGNLWRCDGANCALTSDPKEPNSPRSCRELQRQVGALSAYGSKDKPFDGDKLAKCNAAE